MESATNKQNHEADKSRSSSRTRFIRDEATLSAFRKRNKKLIIVLLLLAITTLSTIGSILFHLVRRNHTFNRQRSAIRAFCQQISTNSYDSTPCEMEYYSLVARNDQDDTYNPNKVLYLSLRTASEELEAIIRTWGMAADDPDEFRNNCSSIALRDAKGEISHCLEMILSSRTLAEEQRVEIWNRTIKAIDGLKSACLESSSSSSSSVSGQMARVEMHLNHSEDYLMRYYEALRVFFDDVVDGKITIFVGIFSEGMVGLQFLFMFFLILSLFRT